MFADDTSIQCSSSTVVELEQSLQRDMNAVQAWIKANKLNLNSAETFVIHADIGHVVYACWHIVHAFLFLS